MGLQAGEILDGKYRIVRLVGEGGMGAVYEGENTRIKRRVAIKVLHAAVAEKTDVVQRFEREAQAAGRIGSEHIVEVLDLGSLPSGERFMVMEFLAGEDLTSRIKGRKRLTPQECVPLMSQVLSGLSAAHDAQIVHRDLKPDNIFILASKAGRPDFVKILDFGVSKFSALDNEMSMTRTGAVMGTPYYMSPEQAKGGKVDNRSDIYALGVVLYQMVTGRVPFNAGSFNELLFKIALETPEPVQQIVPDCPPEFVAIIDKAMAREAEDRFQSCRDFQYALDAWAQGGGTAILAAHDYRASAPSYSSLPGSGSGYPPIVPASGSYPGAAASYPSYPTPAGSTGAHPQLASSQVGYAVTPTPRSGRGSLMLGLLAAVVLVVAGGAVGAYVFTKQGAGDAVQAAGPAPTDAAAAEIPPIEDAPPPDPSAEQEAPAEIAEADGADSANPEDGPPPAGQPSWRRNNTWQPPPPPEPEPKQAEAPKPPPPIVRPKRPKPSPKPGKGSSRIDNMPVEL